MIIAMTAYNIHGDLHGTHCNGFIDTIHMNVVLKALLSFGAILSLVVTFWIYSFSSSKFFLGMFKLHSDVKVPYLMWFSVWALVLNS